MRRSKLATCCFLLANVAWLAACDSDLPQATEIARMRVLGAQLSVEGEPERATPAPGETVEVRFPVVFPSVEDSTADVQMFLIGCTAPTRYTGGLPICQELIDAVVSGEDFSDALPMVVDKINCDQLPQRDFAQGALSYQCLRGTDMPAVIDVPEDFEAPEMLFRGVICEHGAPYIDPNDPLLFGCEEEDAEAVRVHGTFRIQHQAEDVNHNPDLSALTVTRKVVAEVAWPAFDPEDLPAEQGCGSDRRYDEEDFADPVHRVSAGPNDIVLRYDGRARERVDGEPEDLEITVYTTLGEMERRFTLFQGSAADDELESELEWEPPPLADLIPGGELVRFFVTVRDQRGGFAMTSRAVCINRR